MITDSAAFLRYFDSIHRRTLRDIQALPTAASSWAPDAGEGEKAWSISEIVGHIAESRIYFAKAYRHEGWIYDWKAPITGSQSSWLPTLEASAEEFHRRIQDTPAGWLDRRVPMIDTDASLSGWRVLMMMLEHEVHHRSQIDTYAGLQGWDVPQIFGRYREQVELLQEDQKRLHHDK
jgi:uncharacterized damage-inducible protein DinB